MSLNRLFSDTIYQLMWDTKKSENILIPRPLRGPTLDTKNSKVGRRRYDLSFQNWNKMQQLWITTMSQNIQVKACIVYEDPFDVVVVVFVLERATKLRSYWDGATVLSDRLVPFWCKEYICLVSCLKTAMDCP